VSEDPADNEADTQEENDDPRKQEHDAEGQAKAENDQNKAHYDGSRVLEQMCGSSP
jgi:hypothetical protein